MQVSFTNRPQKCREEIAVALQEFGNRWCKRGHDDSNTLNSITWKLINNKILKYDFFLLQ